MAEKRAAALGLDRYPLVAVLRNYAQYHAIVSMFTRQALVWRSKDDWKDLFQWEKADPALKFVQLSLSK
jgi:hypothetical protein